MCLHLLIIKLGSFKRITDDLYVLSALKDPFGSVLDPGITFSFWYSKQEKSIDYKVLKYCADQKVHLNFPVRYNRKTGTNFWLTQCSIGPLTWKRKDISSYSKDCHGEKWLWCQWYSLKLLNAPNFGSKWVPVSLSECW